MDLTGLQAKPLSLKLRGGGGRVRTYQVPPPTTEMGITLSAVMAYTSAIGLGSLDACPTCGQSRRPDEIPEEIMEIVEKVSKTPLGHLSLSEPVYRKMERDGVPGDDVTMASFYAAYYWNYGKHAAQGFLDTWAARTDYTGESADSGPKDPSPPKSGPSMVLVNPTKTATTPNTSFQKP